MTSHINEAQKALDPTVPRLRDDLPKQRRDKALNEIEQVIGEDRLRTAVTPAKTADRLLTMSAQGANQVLAERGYPTRLGDLICYDSERMSATARNAHKTLITIDMLARALAKIEETLHACGDEKAVRKALRLVHVALHSREQLACLQINQAVRVLIPSVKKPKNLKSLILGTEKLYGTRRPNELDNYNETLEPRWVHEITQWITEDASVKSTTLARRIYKCDNLNPTWPNGKKLFPKSWPDRGIYEHVRRIRKALKRSGSD